MAISRLSSAKCGAIASSSSTLWRLKRSAWVRAVRRSRPIGSSTLCPLISAESSVSRSMGCTPSTFSGAQCVALRARATVLRCRKVLAHQARGLFALRHVVDGQYEHTCLAGTGHAHQIQPRGPSSRASDTASDTASTAAPR